MPFDIHIVRPSDFVRLDARGQLDMVESRRVLAGLAQTCLARGVEMALLDVRDVYTSGSLTDLYLLARSFHEMGFREHQRLAVLHRYNSTERAEFFAMCAQDRGFDVSCFDNFEEAIEWLNRPREEPRKIRVQ